MPDADLRPLLDSWEIHLRAERKSPGTIRVYLTGVKQYLAFCERTGHPLAIARDAARLFVVDLLDRGLEASTAAVRLQALCQFSGWLLEEEEIDSNPLLGLKPPRPDEKVTPRLTEEQCADLIKACKGATFRDRRDEAIVRYMLEAIVRAGEVVGQSTADFDLARGMSRVFGKGRRERLVPFSPQTARAIDRYLRVRRAHRLADTPAMWLGDRGTTFSYAGLWGTLKWRAQLAGIADFHPHLTRHTAAQRWRAAGGSEEGLMAIGGWRDRATMARYTVATSVDRAVEEARGLNLGDL